MGEVCKVAQVTQHQPLTTFRRCVARKEIVSMKVEGFIEDSALDVAAKRLT